MDNGNNIHDIIYVYEGAQARLERSNKRLWILSIILIAVLLLTNAAWIVYEAQFQTIEETTQVTQENENGYNNYIGNDGDINNGKAKSDNNKNGKTN